MPLIAPKPILHAGNPGHTLLRRVLRVPGVADGTSRVDVLDGLSWRIRLHDSGPDGTGAATCDAPTALHLLWALDDAAAILEVNGVAMPVAPGDMLVAPRGSRWRASSGLLFAEITAPGADSPDTIIEPTHGEEIFHGYNRRTAYPSAGDLRIERWKVTQPLALPATRRDYAVLGLARSVALSWPGGTDLLAQGTLRVVPAGTGPITLLPDGLGYVLLVARD